MFRRARLNVRPNVRPTGRGAGSAADPKPQGSDSPVAASTESTAGEATEPPPVASGVESDDKADGSNDAAEASKPAELPIQRRKRISTMPNLVKPRPAPSSARQPASKPQTRASQAPDGSALLQKEASPSEKSHAESPVKPPMLPEKKTPVPQVPQFSPLKKSVSKEQTVSVAAQKNDDGLQKNGASPLKERPTQERSGAQEENLPTKPPPVKEKRTCSDRERILKARKLREMLKEELKKERMLKHRPPVIEGRSPPDHSKMTMRDLIYYLPENNPMKSSLAEDKRTERNSALSQMKEQEEKNTPDCEDDDEKEERENEESQDGPLLVPRVKVAEDGSIILDEESLTVEVLRTKGPCVVEENDPIFERGSTTTYSSFRKSFYTKPWSNKETDMFFLAISMVGTDFSLIGRLFPHRARAEIKNKFKREEKANGWRIDKAFKEKRPFDFEFFAQLLEKVLADEEKRKQKTVKSQKPKEKKPSRPRKKPKAKNINTEAANEQGDLQEARISDAEADAVMAEKENEESLSISEEAEQIALEPALAKKKRKRKRKDDLEEGVEDLLEETAVPSKAAEELKSSKKIAEKKVSRDASNDGHTASGEEMDSIMEGNQGDSAVTREERAESCLPVDHRTETESNVNLCSFEEISDVILETNSAKLRTQDVRDGTLQESHISELTVAETRSKERQSEETRETKNKEGQELPRPEESQSAEEDQSASESDSQSETMKNKKRARRGKVQTPQSTSKGSSRRRNSAPQEKMEGSTSSPVPENADKECSAEDSRRNRDEATAGENMDLESESQEAEKSEEAAAAQATGGGLGQRFKPRVTRASARREEAGKDAGKDEVSHPQSNRRTRKNADPSNSSDPASEVVAGKADKGLKTVSEKTEKGADSEQLQRPKPDAVRSTGRKKAACQEEMEIVTSSSVPVNADKECSAEDSRRNRDEATAGENMDLESESQEAEKSEEAVAAQATGGGRWQRFKPRVTRASARREEAGKDAGKDEVSHPQSNRRTRKNADPSNSSDPASEVVAGKADKGLKTVSESNEAAGLQEDSKQSVLKPAPLKRGRKKRSTPNLPQTVARQKGMTGGKYPEEKTASGQVEAAVIHQRDGNKDPSPKTDVMAHEDAQPCNVVLEEGVPSDSKMDTRLKKQSSQEKSAEEEGYESEKELSDVLKKVSELKTGEPYPQKDEKKSGLRSGWFLRTLLQKPEPNLRTTDTRKEELAKAGEDEVLQPVEPLKTKSLGSKVFSVGQSSEPTKTFSRSEHGELKSCPPEPNQDDTSTTNASKNITEEESKETPLQLAQLVQSRFQRYKPNLEGAVRRGSRIPEKEKEKKLEAEQLVLQKDESANTVIAKSEAALGPSDLLSKEEQKQQEMPQVPCVSGSKPCEQSSAEKSTSQEGKLGALKPGQLTRHESVRARPNLKRVPSKESPMAQKLAAPIEEEANKGENPPVAEGSEEPVSSKDNSEALFERESAEGDNLDVTPESMESEALSSSEKSSDCHSKGEQGTYLPTDGVGDVEDTMESDKFSSGKESQESDTQTVCQVKKPHWEPRPNLMGVTGRGNDPKEGENRGEDTAENRDAAKHLMLEEPGVSSQNSSKGLEATPFSKATRKRNFTEPVETPSKRSRWNTRQSPETSSEGESSEGQYYSCQRRVQLQKRKQFRRPIKWNALQKHFLDQDTDASSECESDCSEEENQTQDVTLHSTGKNFSIAYRKKFGNKPFWASQEKEEEKDDTKPDENKYFTLEEVNKVPEFVPTGLPKPAPVQMDETMEEIAALMSVPGVQVAADAESHFSATPKTEMQKQHKESTSAAETTVHEDPEVDKGIKDGSSEAAMTLLAMGGPKFQLKIGPEGTFPKELLPSGYESMINAEDQSTGTGTNVNEYFEQNATETRREGEMQGRNSGGLTAESASLKPKEFCLEVDDCPNQSSVAGISEQSPCHAEASVCTINSHQIDTQQRCVSSTEATSVVKDDSKCLEEEQSFILTLVGISNYSKSLDASPLLEDIPEEYLPAPIIIKPVKTRDTVATEVENTGSLATADDEFAEPLCSLMKNKRLPEPLVDLQTVQKRSSPDPGLDSPPSKKTASGAEADGNLETIYKDYATKSEDSPGGACASPFQDTDDLSKENLLSSLLLFDSMTLLSDKTNLETLETLKSPPPENEASKQEEELVMSGLTSKSKAEISGKQESRNAGKQEHVHEFALLEPTVSLPSKSPLFSTGQKTLGFLPSTHKESSSESTEHTKGKTKKTQSPQIVTPKQSPKDATLSTEDDKESCSFPSTITSLSMEDEKVAAEAAVKVPTNKPHEMPPLCEEDQEKEEEATKISEYFFSDIFMEVNDSD